jgi:hypothetical protein
MARILALSTIVVVSAATLSRYGMSNNNDGKIRRTAYLPSGAILSPIRIPLYDAFGRL